MARIKTSTETRKKANLTPIEMLRLQMAKHSVDDRNQVAAERSYRVRACQLTREVRYARETGSPTEKAVDYPTQITAYKKGNIYTDRECRELLDIGDRASLHGNWEGELRPWCQARGRNTIAAKQKTKALLRARRNRK